MQTLAKWVGGYRGGAREQKNWHKKSADSLFDHVFLALFAMLCLPAFPFNFSNFLCPTLTIASFQPFLVPVLRAGWLKLPERKKTAFAI